MFLAWIACTFHSFILVPSIRFGTFLASIALLLEVRSCYDKSSNLAHARQRVLYSLGAGERESPRAGFEGHSCSVRLLTNVCLRLTWAVWVLYFAYIPPFCGCQHCSNFGLMSGLFPPSWTWGGFYLVRTWGSFVFIMDSASAAVLPFGYGRRVSNKVHRKCSSGEGECCKKLRGASGPCVMRVRRGPRLEHPLPSSKWQADSRLSCSCFVPRERQVWSAGMHGRCKKSHARCGCGKMLRRCEADPFSSEFQSSFTPLSQCGVHLLSFRFHKSPTCCVSCVCVPVRCSCNFYSGIA